MSNVVSARAAEGDRAPSPIDATTVFATHFFFESAASLNFGGTNEHVVGPSLDALGLTITNQFSVGLWFKWNETPNSFQGIANASSTWQNLDDGWGLYWNSTSQVTFFVNQWNGNFAQAPVGDVNDWNFLVGVYDGTLGSDNVKLYVNGVLGGTTDDFTGDVTQPANVELARTANDMSGSNEPAADHAVANLDEFGLWNTALSSDAITTIYNSGAPTNLAIDSGNYIVSQNLALWWRCGEAGDSNTSNGINDRSVVGNSNTGTSDMFPDASAKATPVVATSAL